MSTSPMVATKSSKRHRGARERRAPDPGPGSRCGWRRTRDARPGRSGAGRRARSSRPPRRAAPPCPRGSRRSSARAPPRRRRRRRRGGPISVSVRTFLATPKAWLNSAWSTGPTVPARLRQREGVLHLAQDLRLAEDHRVEARRDPEDVAHRLVLGLRVEQRLDRPRGRIRAGRRGGRRPRAAPRPAPRRRRRPRRGCTWRGSSPLASTPAPARSTRISRSLSPSSGELLAHLDGRRVMTEAGDEERAHQPRSIRARRGRTTRHHEPWRPWISRRAERQEERAEARDGEVRGSAAAPRAERPPRRASRRRPPTSRPTGAPAGSNAKTLPHAAFAHRTPRSRPAVRNGKPRVSVRKVSRSSVSSEGSR